MENKTCPVCYSIMEVKTLFTSIYYECPKCNKESTKRVPIIDIPEWDREDDEPLTPWDSKSDAIMDFCVKNNIPNYLLLDYTNQPPIPCCHAIMWDEVNDECELNDHGNGD